MAASLIDLTPTCSQGSLVSTRPIRCGVGVFSLASLFGRLCWVGSIFFLRDRFTSPTVYATEGETLLATVYRPTTRTNSPKESNSHARHCTLHRAHNRVHA